MKKALLTLALAATTIVGLAALERATFVLTDGSRVSGTLVFHTDERSNFRPDKSEFNLGLDGRERAVPASQIVMIDFTGARQQTAEIASLGDTPTLVLLSGEKITGALLDFIGGDTIKWKTTEGDTRTYAVTSARRIYMQPERVRTMFNVVRAADSPSGGEVAGVVGADGKFEVQSRAAWVNTGIVVRQGEPVRFITSGTVRIREGGRAVNGEGDAASKSPSYPVPEFPGGGLICKIGNGKPFSLGQRSDAVAMGADGVLYLGVNDDQYTDNSGSFRVQIIK